VVKSIAIYVEGGGDTAQTLNPFRQGMSDFLKPVVNAVRKDRIQWRVIPCGSRKQAYDAFVDALNKEPDVFNVLLVDSEDLVAANTVSPWDHLKNREGDKWDKPEGADDARCQLMVVCMEAWFLADHDGLKRHFGGNFDCKKLPPVERIETCAKTTINEALKKAAKNTKAKEYHKIRDGAKLLGKIDSSKVRKYCKWCDRLFLTLGKEIGVDI
jgi:hypothetical protein